MFFIITIGISAFARYQLSRFNTDFQFLYFGLGLVTLSFGIVFICLTLRVIESVAVTSEEAAFTREVEALKKAMKETEEEKKPKLKVSLNEKMLPISMRPESNKDIEFKLEIGRGDIAKQTGLFVHAPSGFEFLPESVRCTPYAENVVSAFLSGGNVLQGIEKRVKVTIKAPLQPNQYIILYRCICEGFNGEMKSFNVEVK